MLITKILKSRSWLAAWQFSSRLFILMGLPLLAWGVDDFSGFFANPARVAFTAIAVLQTLFHAGLVYISPPEPVHEYRFDLARWHAYLFEMIFVLSAYGDRRNILAWDENMSIRWSGLGIYMIGVILSIWADLTWVNVLRREAGHVVDHPVLLF